MKGWLDKYVPKAQNGIEGTMGGLTDKGFNYSPAWGGQFQDGGYVDSVLNANKHLDWVQRLYEKNTPSIQIPGQKGRSTHFMESGDGRVYPTVVKTPSGELKYLGKDAYNYADSTKTYIQFPSDKEAQWFGKNYKKGKGVLSSFQMGGNIPGSVGFTYARTGDIPDNGKYAKKTLPSAQNGRKQGNIVSDWWYNLDDVQGTYKMYNELDPFLKNWYQNPETQRRLKENLLDGLSTTSIDPKKVIAQTLNTLEKTPVFSRELVKKANVSQSDIEYNNSLQGWKSPSALGGSPYFDSYNYVTGASELGSYDPETKQIIVNSFDSPGTIAHEGTHSVPELQSAMDNVIKWKYLSKRNPKDRFVEQFGTSDYDLNIHKFTKETFDDVKKRVPYLHESWLEREKYLDKDGMYPRIMDIRRTLNLKPGQKVDKSILQNESIRSPLSDLNHYYDNDTIIEMLNTLAKNNSKQEIASAQNGKEMKYYQEGLDFQPKTISRDGKVIKDDRGQWAHPGEITQIDSNDITMQGVPYPVLGIGADGQRIMMEPGEDYRFNKGPVIEFPMAQNGIRQPIYVDNPNDPRLKAYQDSLGAYQRFKSLYNKGLETGIIPHPRDGNIPVFGVAGRQYLTRKQAIESDYDTYVNKFGLKLTRKDIEDQYKQMDFVPGKVKNEAVGYYRFKHKNDSGDYTLAEYKKPVQPVVYKKPEREPIIVNDPNDPKIKAYQDSLQVYNSSKFVKEHPLTGKYVPGKEDVKQMNINIDKKNINKYKPKLETTNTGYYYNYKKPVQPVEYRKQEPKKEPVVEKPVEKPTQKVVEKPVPPKPMNKYEGRPFYAPGAGVGGPSPLVGFIDDRKGDTTYIQPEDYERFAVDPRGRKYIESKKKLKSGGNVNNIDAQPLKKLDQLTNFTNYNKPTKGGWLDKWAD